VIVAHLFDPDVVHQCGLTGLGTPNPATFEAGADATFPYRPGNSPPCVRDMLKSIFPRAVERKSAVMFANVAAPLGSAFDRWRASVLRAAVAPALPS
jgi:hypothetical protein